MMRILQNRMRTLGVVMTFLALLFAFTPSLEAMACAAEGCDLACSEQSAATVVSDATGFTDDGCVDANCVYAAGHCSHSAVAPATTGASVALFAAPARTFFETDEPVFTPANAPERPPRV